MLSCQNVLDVYVNNYKLVLYSDVNVAYAWMLGDVQTCDVTGLLYMESRNQPVLVIAELQEQSMLYSLV